MSDFDPEVPSDLEAEMVVLGSMMQDPGVYDECCEIVTARDFTRPAHREVLEAIGDVADRGDIPGMVTVKAELEKRGTLGKVGGALYLHDLVASVPAAVSAPWFAARVRECSVRWRLAQAGASIRAAALSGQADLADRVERVYQVLEEASGEATPARSKSAAELIDPVLEAIAAGPDTSVGVTSGWTSLDVLVPGFKPGEMVVVGARPSVGKSVVMLNWAAHAALGLGVPVLLCSLEMSETECMERLIAATGVVSLQHLRSRQMDETDWEKARKARARLISATHLIINDNPYMGIGGIRSELRSMRRSGSPAGLVVVDYLQLMTNNAKSENRQAEVAAMSRGLKLLAKEFEVPVVVGSQLNRGSEMRQDKKPVPSDLRESGSVEQDSDIVILLHREDMYDKESPRAGEIDLIVAKNRGGARGTAALTFQGHYARCAEMAPMPAPHVYEEAA